MKYTVIFYILVIFLQLSVVAQSDEVRGPLIHVFIYSRSSEEAEHVIQQLKNQGYKNWRAHVILPETTQIYKPKPDELVCNLSTRDLIDETYLQWVKDYRNQLKAPETLADYFYTAYLAMRTLVFNK